MVECNFTKRELQIIANLLKDNNFSFKMIDDEVARIINKANKFRGKKNV